MKKFIAILTILAIVTCSVFAAASDTAKTAEGKGFIDIVTSILEQAPKFQLKATAATTEAEGDTDNVINVAISNVATGETATHGKVTLSTNALVDGDGTVTFAINQIATARTTAIYDLKVTAGDLLLVKYATTQTAPTGTLTAAEKFTIVDGTPAVTASAPSIKGAVLTTVDMATLSADENILTVTYKGVVAAADAQPVTLGTFSCTWEQNADAVPGDYQATVQLEVVAK